jgi:hypothetical protein
MKHLVNRVINYFSFSKTRYYYYSRDVYDERYMIDFHDEDDKRDYENGKMIYEWRFGNLNGTPVKDIQYNCEELVSGQVEWFLDETPQWCIILLITSLCVEHGHLLPKEQTLYKKECVNCSRNIESGKWEKKLDFKIRYDDNGRIII